jgi:hypothetical protein
VTFLHALPETALKGAGTGSVFDLLARADEEAQEWKKAQRRSQRGD